MKCFSPVALIVDVFKFTQYFCGACFVLCWCEKCVHRLFGFLFHVAAFIVHKIYFAFDNVLFVIWFVLILSLSPSRSGYLQAGSFLQCSAEKSVGDIFRF